MSKGNREGMGEGREPAIEEVMPSEHEVSSYDAWIERGSEIINGLPRPVSGDASIRNKVMSRNEPRIPRYVGPSVDRESNPVLVSFGPLSFIEQGQYKVFEPDEELQSMLLDVSGSELMRKLGSLFGIGTDIYNRFLYSAERGNLRFRGLFTVDGRVIVEGFQRFLVALEELLEAIREKVQSQRRATGGHLGVIREFQQTAERLKQYDGAQHAIPRTINLVDARVIEHVAAKESEGQPSAVAISLDTRLLLAGERKEIPEAILRLGELQFERGGITTIVGPNGCGKSTFSRALETAIVYYQQHPEASHEEILRSTNAMLVGQIGAVVNPSIPSWVAGVARCMNVNGLRGSESCICIDISRGGEHALARARESDNPLQTVSKLQKTTRASTGEVQLRVLDDAQRIFGLGEYTGVVIFDEPEKGLDAWKLVDLKARLRSMAPKATILVVTHNPMLVFDVEIPRLDLRYPERGVHINREEALFHRVTSEDPDENHKEE